MHRAVQPEYEMVWINTLEPERIHNPVQADLDWTGSDIHKLSVLLTGLDRDMSVIPTFIYLNSHTDISIFRVFKNVLKVS